MLFKNFSSFGVRNSSVRCRDRIMSRPARKVKLRSKIPTTSSLLVGEIDLEISKHAGGHPFYNMEETPPIIGRRRRFPDEFSSGSPISGKSKRTEDIFIREDEDGIRSHYCPLNSELDGRDWNEDDRDRPVQFDFNFEKLINSCSVPSEDIPLLLSSKGSSSESDEDSDGSVISYAPLESEASTSRNSTVSLTNVGYAPLENEPSTNENSPVSQKNLTSRFLQLPEKISSYARLEEGTMEAWLDDSSDEFEYYAPHVKYLPDVKFTNQDGSDMEEFEQDSDSENENDNLKSAKNKEKKDGGYKDKGDRDEGYKDFLADSKYSKNKVENESSTEYPSKLSKIEHSESKNACKNKQLSNLNAQDRNENEEEYPEINKDEGNNDLSTYTTSAENNAKNESSTELSNKMSKFEHLKSQNANKNEQTSNLNTQDENQKEREHVKINSESDSIVIGLYYSDNADRNNIESNLNIQDENKDKEEGKESENVSKNEQSRNLNAEDENQNKKKHPEYNIESYSTALDIHLLDNVDRNGIESNLNIQDDYKDEKGEKGNENTNKNEQPTNLNVEEENQNEKKYPDYNIESDSTAIDINLLDNVDRNGIESNLSTQDDYKGKKEEKGSESTNEKEHPTNLNAEDENQNEKKYPENNIESVSTAIDINLLDNVDRNGIESNLSTQDDYKDKKEEKGSESTNENEQPTNLNAEDENQNEKKYPDYNIESVSTATDINLLDNVDRNGIESNLSTQDDYKDKKEGKGSESTNEKEHPTNINAEDENQNEKKYPDYNIESDSTAIDLNLLDNVDRNGIESNLSTQDDYKDKKEEKGSESTNEKEQPTNINAEDENQNEKKYPDYNIESDSTAIDLNLLDNVHRNGIESNLSTQDDYKDKKEEKGSESTNEKEHPTNLNAEDENQNEKKYPDYNIESDSTAIDLNLLDNVDRNGIESNLSTQDDYKDKKEEKGSESTNENEQPTNLNAEDENQNEKKYPDYNIESVSTATDINLLDNVDRNGIESNLSTQDDYKDKKEGKGSESTNEKEQPTNINAEDENQNEKKYPDYNIESDSTAIDLNLLDNVDRNGIESNLSTQDDYKDKKEEKGSESTNEKEQPTNINAEDENQNEKKYPDYNIESDSTAIDLNLLDNVHRNGIESNLSTQDDYKDKKEEKGSESTNENEQPTNLNAEDENQNEKKYPDYNIESDSTAIDLNLLDNVDRNGIESNLSTQDDYKDKKEEKGSESTNEKEQPTNINAEDENQNEKKYPENNIESDSFTIDIPLLDNVDRNGIESNLSTQDYYKDKKEEKGNESTNEKEQPTNLNAEDENQNEKKYPENNIESDSFTIDIPLLDNVDRNGIESNLSTQDYYKDKKEEKGNESTNEKEQPTNLNAEDENQNEKKYPENNIESDSTAIDILLLDNADRNDIESNKNTHDDNKDKNEEKESESTDKNEQPTNLNAEDENQNEKKYPDYNIESDSTAIDLNLLDNVDRNGIESNLSTQDDYKDKKEEKGSESTNENEQPTNLNAEDENQNEKKYPDYNIESDSTAIDLNLLDNVDRNGIESNLSTQDDYKDKKEEKGSESTNEKEQPTNINAEDENQNEKKYPENNIESDSFTIDIPLLDNVDRKGIESNLSTQDYYKDKKEEKGNESTNEKEQPTNLNAEDENQNEKKYPENNIESDSFTIDIPLLDNVDRNGIESNLSTQDYYKDKKEEKGNESTNEKEQPTNLNAEDENQNEKKYPENNIESDSTAIDILLLDNADRNDIESNKNTHDDNKDKNEEKESESTDKNEQPTNLNAEDENQNEKKYLENNLGNDSTETDIHYLDITDRNGIESNLNTQDENKDEKEESENDSKNDYFSEGISLPDFDNINGPVSNLNTYSIARLKFRDLLRALLPGENKDKKEEPESDSKNDFISGVIPLEDFYNINRPVLNLNIQDENKDKIMQTESYSKDDYIFEITNNINGPVSNLSIQDENKVKNVQTESASKDDYIFEITNFRDFVSLHGSVSNLNTQDENNGYKTQEAENDLKNDYIFDIISFPDFVSLNGSASSLSTHDKNEDKKELKSDSKNYFISEGISLTDSDSMNEPVSNLTTRDENKDKKEHPESDLKTDYISEGIHWADFDSVNVPVSNSNTQDKNKVKKEHPESNLETGFAENFLHCADNGQKEKYAEIGGFSNKMDDNRNDFSYDFFPKSQTKPAIKPKIKENMATLTAEPYGRTIPKSIKKDETQPGLKRLQRFMSGIYPTKDKNELHFVPSITRDVGDKMPLEEKGIIFDINDALVLADLPVHDSGGFQPVLTEEQSVASRQPNKFTKFFQSLKKKLERNKKA